MGRYGRWVSRKCRFAGQCSLTFNFGNLFPPKVRDGVGKSVGNI